MNDDSNVRIACVDFACRITQDKDVVLTVAQNIYDFVMAGEKK